MLRLQVESAPMPATAHVAGCGAHNGTYSCQLEAGHASFHACRFTSAGKRRLARFRDNYSAVRFTADRG